MIQGNYLFAVVWERHVKVYNISNPLAITEVEQFGCAQVRDMVLSGNVAYLSCNWAGFQVYDITDPNNIGASIASACPGCDTFNMDVANDVLGFSSDDGKNLYFYDVSTPTAPVLIDSFNDNGADFSLLRFHNARIYAADSNAGLRVFDSSDLTNLAEIGSALSPPENGSISCLDIQGNVIFAAVQSRGVMIIDISDPLLPRVVETLPTRHSAMCSAFKDEYLLVPDNKAGLSVYEGYTLP